MCDLVRRGHIALFVNSGMMHTTGPRPLPMSGPAVEVPGALINFFADYQDSWLAQLVLNQETFLLYYLELRPGGGPLWTENVIRWAAGLRSIIVRLVPFFSFSSSYLLAAFSF